MHWVVYNLPNTARRLPEGVPSGELIAGGGKQGSNSWGTPEYGGPCPPQGTMHTYVFTLYALDIELELVPEANKRELLSAMDGHVLAAVELAASFTR
ncbi:MAG: YbhB/YbcL family Raf kinase inhibitor-like protein [Anaerolineales bacterium]